MLPAQRRNPSVVARNRSARLFELSANPGIPDGRFLIYLQNTDKSNHLLQPALVLAPVPRLDDSEAILTQDNDRNGNLTSAGKLLGCSRFSLGNGRESVRVEDQARS